MESGESGPPITRRNILKIGAAVGLGLLKPNPQPKPPANLFLPSDKLPKKKPEIEPKQNVRMIFVHGWQGGGSDSKERDGSFVDALKDLQEQQRIEGVYPSFPDSANPSIRKWALKIREEVEKSQREGKQVILVGYSLGSRAALWFLEKALKNQEGYKAGLAKNIAGLILIAPLSNDIKNAARHNGAYKDFFEKKLDTAAIAKAVPKIAVIHSQDDPNVPVAFGESLSKELKVPLIRKNGIGHLHDKGVAAGKEIIGDIGKTVNEVIKIAQAKNNPVLTSASPK